MVKVTELFNKLQNEYKRMAIVGLVHKLLAYADYKRISDKLGTFKRSSGRFFYVLL